MLLMVIVGALLAGLTCATSGYHDNTANYYSYEKAYGRIGGHPNLRSTSYENYDGSHGYSYQYGDPRSNVQVSFTSSPSYAPSNSGSYFRQSPIKSGVRPHYQTSIAVHGDQYASSSLTNDRYLLPVVYGDDRSYSNNQRVHYGPISNVQVHDVDSSKQYPIGGHQYSVGTYKIPAFPTDQTKYSSNPVNEMAFSDLYRYHPDTFRYAHPEKIVPLNVFGLPPRHQFQHPVGNVRSALPVVVHTNAQLAGPVVDRGVKKGSGHYEDSSKFHRLYDQHPDTIGYVNPSRNVPLNVFGLPAQHRYQSHYGNVNSYPPQIVRTNAQLAGPVVDVLLNQPSLSSSFTGRVPTTGDLQIRNYGSSASYANPSVHHERRLGQAQPTIMPVTQNYQPKGSYTSVETNKVQRPYAQYSQGPIRYTNINIPHHEVKHQSHSINVQQPLQSKTVTINPTLLTAGNIIPALKVGGHIYRDVVVLDTDRDNKNAYKVKPQETKSYGHSYVNQGNIHDLMFSQYPVTQRTEREYRIHSTDFSKNSLASPQSPQFQVTEPSRTENKFEKQQEISKHVSVVKDPPKRKFIYQRPPLDHRLIRLPSAQSVPSHHKNYNYAGMFPIIDVKNNQQIHRQNPAKFGRISTNNGFPKHESRRYQYGSLDYTPISRSKFQEHNQGYKPGSIGAMLLTEFLKFGMGLTKSVTPITEPGYSYNQPRKGFHMKLGLHPFLETKVLF